MRVNMAKLRAAYYKHNIKVLGDIIIELDKNGRVLLHKMKAGNDGSYVRTIIMKVCERFEVRKKDILSKKAWRPLPMARQVAVFLARKYTDLTWEQLGVAFQRAHPTLMYSLDKVTNNFHLYEADVQAVEEAMELLEPKEKTDTLPPPPQNVSERKKRSIEKYVE